MTATTSDRCLFVNPDPARRELSDCAVVRNGRDEPFFLKSLVDTRSRTRVVTQSSEAAVATIVIQYAGS